MDVDILVRTLHGDGVNGMGIGTAMQTEIAARCSVCEMQCLPGKPVIYREQVKIGKSGTGFCALGPAESKALHRAVKQSDSSFHQGLAD